MVKFVTAKQHTMIHYYTDLSNCTFTYFPSKTERVNSFAHLSTGVEVFSMKLIIFSFTFTDLDLRANVILFTRDLTPLPSPELLSDSP